MQLIQYARSIERHILGERAYKKVAQSFLRGGLLRKLALTEFARRTVLLRERDIAQLHDREVATTLSLGIQYAYNSFIEGDVVEFGTAFGVTARVISRAMLVAERARPKKTLHLFDSFVGLPDATSDVDRNSFEFRTGVWRAGICKLLTKDELFEQCAGIVGAERVKIHEGWFKDTVARIPPEQKFAFIHFDGDMYQSTIDAIGGLFARGAISNGAVICFDDWNCGQADPNFGERKAWSELTRTYDVKFSAWRSYSTMGQSFFIHDYRRS
jgi:hypothetical protein